MSHQPPLFGAIRTGSSSSSLVSCCYPLRPTPLPLPSCSHFPPLPFSLPAGFVRPTPVRTSANLPGTSSSSVLSARVSCPVFCPCSVCRRCSSCSCRCSFCSCCSLRSFSSCLLASTAHLTHPSRNFIVSSLDPNFLK